MITLFVNKEEHIFDIQFKLPFVNDKLDKKMRWMVKIY